jgi:RNA-directed DNA polymerase
MRSARQRCWRYAWVLDLDIKAFFDSIDTDLLMRAVRKHTDCPWALMYIARLWRDNLDENGASIRMRRSGRVRA